MRPLEVSITGIACYTDEMRLDLREIPPGLVAVTGDIGGGKSTLLECTGPATLTLGLPSKAGILCDYATRRDARIEHAFEHNGHEFRSIVQVDPQHGGGRGRVEAFLEMDGAPIGAYPTPGRVGDYKQAVAALLPDPTLYLASAYSAQFGNSDFFSLTVPERRDLFTTLLGNEHLQTTAQRAELHRKHLDALLVDIEREETKLAADLAKAEQLDADIAAHATAGPELEQCAADLKEAHGLATATEQKLRAELNQLQEARARVEKQHRSVADQRSTASGEIARLEVAIGHDETVIEKADEIRAGVQALAEAREKRGTMAADYRAAETEERSAGQQLFTARENLRKTQNQGRADLDSATKRAGLIDKVPCGGVQLADCESGEIVDCTTCGFLQEALKAKAALPEMQMMTAMAVAEVEEEIGVAQDLHDAKEKALQEIKTGGSDTRAAIDALAWADRRGPELQTAEARLPERQQALATEQARLEDLEKQLAELEAIPTIPEEQQERMERAARLAVEARSAAEAATQTLEAHRVKAAHLQGQRDALGPLTDTVAALQARREALALRRAGFRLVERGFGRDGLQALEIDSAGPSVSQIATDLLASVYGPRFVISLQTMRPAEGARKAKEVFDVQVHDGERGGPPRSIGDLSGGEKTLISEGLKTAIALFNRSRLGVPVECLMKDESDGALSAEVAAKYPALLRAAMRIGGFRNIFVVTHRESVAEQADCRIEVKDGKAAWRQQI